MSEVLKSIMRLFPNGVAIITTNWNDKLVGMTVNTFNSLSLNPPLVMFFADRIKGNDLPFKQSKAFAINLVDNKEILDVFAKKPVKERFNIVRYMEGIDGVPILTDSYAYIMAGRYNIIDIGDHSIIVGEVINAKVIREKFEPLVYFNRDYSKVNLF